MHRRACAAAPDHDDAAAQRASSARVRATLFTRDREARQLGEKALAGLDLAELDLDDDQLLWVDVCGADTGHVRALLPALGLSPELMPLLCPGDRQPEFRDFGDAFCIRTEAAGFDRTLELKSCSLHVAGRNNVVLSVSASPLGFVRQLHEGLQQNRALGVLGAESFAVALLDGLLGTYYEAMSTLEHEVERLEIRILSMRQFDCLEQLRLMRKASSQVRRLLWAHRAVFGGLARPDFRPELPGTVNDQFATLELRYERAMDRVEHGRDLVVGTFELFTTRATMQTNRTMQMLTFVTVLVGGLAVIAGVLGTNFNTAVFETGDTGFWIAIAAMLGFSGFATWLARRRGWV